VSVRIQVLNDRNQPVEGAKVFVSWKGGGTSSETTNTSGIADLKCSAGTANYILVNNKEVSGSIVLGDKVNQVSDR
jgi:hypothetical protein